MARDTDRDWQYFGQTNPYYGVLSAPEYDASNLTPERIERFYRSGEEHVDLLTRRMTDLLGAPQRFRLAVDFGCGVGRLTIPLARRADQAIGLDVSDGMLELARQRSETEGLGNVSLLRSDDQLSNLTGQPDFIHSYIVFQHIPVDRGMRIVRGLVDRLASGGFGALHLTFGPTDPSRASGRRAAQNRRKRLVKAVLNRLPNFVMRPYMQMNDYPPTEMLTLLHAAGCTSVTLDLIDHEGDLGAYYLFRKD